MPFGGAKGAVHTQMRLRRSSLRTSIRWVPSLRRIAHGPDVICNFFFVIYTYFSLMSLRACRSMASHVSTVVATVELVEEILSWLPPKSVIRFKSVCKQWRSITSTPSFIATHTRRNPHKISGFLLHKSCSNKIYDASFPLEGGSGDAFPETCALNGRILQSCNGLLLGKKVDPLGIQWNFFVYNPTTMQLKILPHIVPWYCFKYGGHLALAFDPSRSTSYHVLVACPLINEVKVYVSGSDSWETFVQAQWVFNLSCYNCYCNGVVYWYNGNGSVISFDIQQRSCKILIPRGPEHSYRGIINFSQSRGRKILILQQKFNGDLVEVLQMTKDHSGWLLLYKVHVKDLLLNYDISEIRQYFPYVVDYACFVEGEENEGDKLALRIHNKSIIYNLRDGTFSELHIDKIFTWLSCANTLVAP